MPPMRGALTKIRDALETVREAAPDRVWLAASMLHHGDDRRRLKRLKTLAQEMCVPLLATNDVLYHGPSGASCRMSSPASANIVTSTKRARLLEANAERHLKSPEEMARLFRDAPDAIAETIRFADRISFSLDQLKYNYPDEPVPQGTRRRSNILDDLTWDGAAQALSGRHSGFRARNAGKRTGADRRNSNRALFPHRARHRRFRERAENPLPGPRLGRQFRRLLSCSASPPSIRRRSICCSNASSPRNARSRPTSTSISSMSGARR